MKTLPPIPVRKEPFKQTKNIYMFKDFLTANEDEIKFNHDKIFIDDMDLLIKNLDFLESIINKYPNTLIYSIDYKILEYINNNLNAKNDYTLSLVNDHKMVNRDYINPNEFDKSKLILPMNYLLWMDELDSNQYITGLTSNEFRIPCVTNAYDMMEIDKLKKIREIINKLGEECKGMDEVERVIYISNYLQNLVQYVEPNNISHADYIYITDSKGLEVTRELVGSGDNVILNKFGLCCGIANATTLLLNNPQLQVNTHSVNGSGHNWNYVQIGDKWYYVDNTWNITRNPNRYEESLKAKSFDGTYLLFGKDKALNIGYHEAESYEPSIEIEDYNKEELQKRIDELSRNYSFDSYEEPIFKSYIKR